jgi:hypothetical protein
VDYVCPAGARVLFFFVPPSLGWFGQATLPPHPPPPHGEGRKTFYNGNQVK